MNLHYVKSLSLLMLFSACSANMGDPNPDSSEEARNSEEVATSSEALTEVKVLGHYEWHTAGNIMAQDGFVTLGGPCDAGFKRQEKPIVKSVGNGYCEHDNWLVNDPASCQARIHVHNNAGWGGVWCYVDITEERPAPRTCHNRCGGIGIGGCYCDRECVRYDDCCDDYELACLR